MDNRIEQKLDKIGERINNIDVTLAAQHVSLAEHVRRTNLLEAKMEPVERHVAMLNGAFKFIALVGVVATIVEAVHQWLK